MALAITAILSAVPVWSQNRAERAVAERGADPMLVRPKDRVPVEIAVGATVPLRGHVHPGARPENDAGPVPGDLPMQRMILSLRPDPAQQAALDAFSQSLQDPHSPSYHKWIKPETFGEHFGLSQGDLDKIEAWLKGLGFMVDEVPSGHWSITFSGTASQVESAFHTPIHYYRVGRELRYANVSDPQIPAALDGIVSGISGLHDFRPRRAPGPAQPLGSLVGGGHYLDPSDFATIYDLNPVYSRGTKGSGVSIAVIETCSMDVSLADTFWSLEGLTQGGVWYWNYGTPGSCSQDDMGEVYLDYEWAGAVAPQAQIWLVSSNAANSLFGAVQGVVTNNFAPVVTLSYSDCESAGDQAWVSLWQQAHTQGITGLVSSGDSGAAACDAFDATTASTATHGAAVNGICASPYVVCVGGTQFNDKSNPGQYWSSAGHALSYIPEVAWNESGTLGSTPTIWGSSGGGYSTIASKPSWQTGNSKSQRGVPDVALTAAAHDGYRTCTEANACSPTVSALTISYGTSAAAPSFAGIMALVVQATGQWQGSPNQALYTLAANANLGVFHDIVSGNDSVAGQPGFSAGPGWDPVTGLGSVDANALVTNWPGVAAPGPTLTNLQVGKAPPPATGCALPASSSSFLTSDNAVYLFFSATVTTADNISSDWLAPNGDVIPGTTWTEVNGSYCFPGAQLNISSEPPAHLGTWQARVYDNGTQIGSVSFTVGSAQPPTIAGLSPSAAIAGTGAFTLNVIGSQFVSGATVLWNGSPLGTSFVSANQLTASVGSALIAAAGSASITVSNAGLISPPATFTINAAVSSNLGRVGVLPQVAAGGGWDTAFYLTNSSSGPVSVAISFHADSGAALTLSFTSTQQGKTLVYNSPVLTATIPANTTLTVDTLAASQTYQGWADVLSNGPVSGFAVFRFAPQGLTGSAGATTPWEGTVPMQTLLTASSVVVPFDNTNGFATGIALGSLTGTAASLTATFFSDTGTPLGSPQVISLPANGHTALILNSSYAFTANLKGLMKVNGPGLIAVGLRASPYGTLTAVPLPLQ